MSHFTEMNLNEILQKTRKIVCDFHHLFVTFSHRVCYNEKYGFLCPSGHGNVLKADNQDRQGVKHGNIQRHFRQSGDHGICKAVPGHYGYPGYPPRCIYHL